MISNNFNIKIISLNSVVSTNIYALELIKKKNANEGTVVWSRFQEKGKGQRGNNWYSNPYKNLTFSLIIEPNLEVKNQHMLSQKIALAVVEYLDSLSVNGAILKWPNDILVDSKKIGGILIENTIQGTRIKQSVIGIGLNVNETQFPNFFREATSLKLVCGNTFQVEEILHRLLVSIKKELMSNKTTQERYLNRLYGYLTLMDYEDKEGAFKGTITGVSSEGKLCINKKGKVKTYEHKEVRFLS